MKELQVRTDDVELPGGRLIRVSRVENPREGETVVIEKLPGSAGARSLLEPADGERLVVDADMVPELVDLLEGSV